MVYPVVVAGLFAIVNTVGSVLSQVMLEPKR